MQRRQFLGLMAGATAGGTLPWTMNGQPGTFAAIGARSSTVPDSDLNALFEGLNLYWGDIHGHTGFSDGYGTPRAYYEYGRQQRNLDFAAVTDHIEWIQLFSQRLSLNDGSSLPLWQMTVEEADRQQVPGSYVTLPGFEWTNDAYGHRNIFFRSTSDLPSNPPTSITHPTPENLWSSLAPHDAMTIPHHSTRWLKFTDWQHVNPQFDRQVEIYSKWGNNASIWTSYEAPKPYRRYPVVRGMLESSGVDAMLELGHRIGIIAGSDTHQGMPGSTAVDTSRGTVLPRPLYPSTGEDFLSMLEEGFTFDDREPTGGGGGLAAAWAASLTRDEIWNALYDRHTCGTTGIRPIVKFGVRDSAEYENAGLMGDELTVSGVPILDLAAIAEPGSAVTHIAIAKGNEVVATLNNPQDEIALRCVDESLAPGQSAFYRAIILVRQQADANLDGDNRLLYDEGANRFFMSPQGQHDEQAWTSPIWITRSAAQAV